MPSIEIRPDAKFGIDEILKGISKLDTENLEKFVDKILAIRANRISGNLTEGETALLKKINAGLPEKKRRRLAELDQKRQDRNLSKAEHAELMAIVETLEKLNVYRLDLLMELALLRGVSLQELMVQLDIRPKPYA